MKHACELTVFILVLILSSYFGAYMATENRMNIIYKGIADKIEQCSVPLVDPKYILCYVKAGEKLQIGDPVYLDTKTGTAKKALYSNIGFATGSAVKGSTVEIIVKE